MRAWQHTVLSVLLLPFAGFYWGITTFRNWLYQRILKPVRLNAKIISVGNITVGGTGKTPFVETIAHYLQNQGKRVVIQSRGYGRRSTGFITVSDGKDLLVSPDLAGDEPYLLARKLPGVPVIVGTDRLSATQQAIERFQPDVVILDDAFQHRRITRDLDIVLLDTLRPWGNGRLLPAGPLRETPENINRAGLIVLTRSENLEMTSLRLNALKMQTDIPIITSKHIPIEWADIHAKKAHTLQYLQHQNLVAFSGIGNPDSFIKTLNEIEIEPLVTMNFKDHHWYTEKDMVKIKQSAVKSGATALVTTEKDGVRLIGLREIDLPIYCLRIECTIDRFELLNQLLQEP
jgi:tetraacyldisaccharide 4'-kinase